MILQFLGGSTSGRMTICRSSIQIIFNRDPGGLYQTASNPGITTVRKREAPVRYNEL